MAPGIGRAEVIAPRSKAKSPANDRQTPRILRNRRNNQAYPPAWFFYKESARYANRVGSGKHHRSSAPIKTPKIPSAFSIYLGVTKRGSSVNDLKIQPRNRRSPHAIRMPWPVANLPNMTLLLAGDGW
jgi:hypothetical protein